MAGKRFRLGTEDELEPNHIGRVILVDYYEARDRASRTLRATTHVGTLAGFAEHRGDATYADRDEARDPDISAHGEYGVTILFTDGRRLDIKEWETAEAWLPELDTSKEVAR